MRNVILAVICIIATSFGANEYLIVMDNLTDQGKKDFFVIEYVRNHFIVIANDNDLAKMKTRNISCQILDNAPRAKEYYLVYPIFASKSRELVSSDRQVFERYGKVIKIFEKCLLMQTSIDNIQRISEYQVKLNYLEMDKLSFETEIDPEYMAIHKRPVQVNPLISDMLKRFEATSTDSADKIERDLVAFKNRFADAKYMKDEVNPYLRAKWKAYGCDSIIETPVTGLAPVVSGVRYGKKNPGLKNGFVSIIGGHTDNWVSGSNSETRFQGAWDGGSSGTGVLEACRLLQYYNFENTIVFSPFTGEEKGMKGATALLSAFKAAGVKSICGWNYDMIGWSGSVRSSTGTAAGSSEQLTKVKSLYATYSLSKYCSMTQSDYAVEEWQERGTDLSAYNSQGYLAVQFMGGGGGSIHTQADTINANYTGKKMAASCIIGAVTLMEYAVPLDPSNVKPNNFSSTNNHNFSIQNSNGTVFIRYSSADQAAPLSITVYNPIGKALATLIPQKQANGTYQAVWNHNAGKVAQGTYLLESKTTKGNISQKILVSR